MHTLFKGFDPLQIVVTCPAAEVYSAVALNRSEDTYAGLLGKREHAVVLEKDDRLVRDLTRNLLMCVVIDGNAYGVRMIEQS